MHVSDFIDAEVNMLLQRIPVEEHYGADFVYEVVERPTGTDSWTVVHTLSSEESSVLHKLETQLVELAIISKNEMGNVTPSTVFRISSAALCQFSYSLFFVFSSC